MKIEIKFGKDYTCWYLTPAIGIGDFSLSTINSLIERQYPN